jgi:hypothetical protein
MNIDEVQQFQDQQMQEGPSSTQNRQIALNQQQRQAMMQQQIPGTVNVMQKAKIMVADIPNYNNGT